MQVAVAFFLINALISDRSCKSRRSSGSEKFKSKPEPVE